MSLLSRIDAVCEQFEAGWRAGQQPQIASYLQQWEDDDRASLFRHLLELDIDYRHQLQQDLDVRAYQSDFPQYRDLIQDTWDRANSQWQQLTGAELPVSTIPFAGAGESDADGSADGSADEEGEVTAQPPLTELARMRGPGDGEAFYPGAMVARRYRIVALLGRGGMGEVYRADDLKLGHPVALKFLPHSLAQDAQRLALFHQEVRLARQVTHPNVCRVFDIGEADGSLFISMEYLDGEDLSRLIRRIGFLPREKAIDIAHQVCLALEAAHRSGVLHRDMKPGNIMLDGRGLAVVTDFGLAKLDAPTAVGPDDGCDDGRDDGDGDGFVGTPAYMAPEQLAEKNATVQSDLYAVGLVLFEMLTGRRPHRAQDYCELQKQRMESSEHLVQAAELPAAIESLIIECLAPFPKDRPRSALELAQRLPGGDPLQAALSSGVTPTPEVVVAGTDQEPGPKWIRLCLLVTVLGIAGNLILSTVALEKLDLGEPPGALSSRARQLLDDIGYPPQPFESAGYGETIALARHAAATDRRWSRIGNRDPSSTYFWFRAASQPLVPRRPNWNGENFLRVDEDRPPRGQTGTLHMRMDLDGKLLRFQANLPNDKPPDTTASQTSASTWQPLLEAAGFAELVANGQLVETQPIGAPPVFADQRVAWGGTGLYEAWPAAEFRVEYAAHNGRAVWFQIVSPWTPVDDVAIPVGMAGGNQMRAWLAAIWLPLLIAAAVWMAHRHLRNGLGDRLSANRLALFLATVSIVVWVLREQHVPHPLELDLLFTGLGAASLLAALVWLAYLSLEPVARRTWPRALIGWTRLIRGGSNSLKDRLVCREILIGITAGTFVGCLKHCLTVVPLLADWPSNPPRLLNAFPLLGGRTIAGELLSLACFAVLYSFVHQLFFLLVLRTVFRRTAPAAIVFVVFLATIVSIQYSPVPWAFALTVVEMSLTVWLLLRCGLLTVIVMHAVRLLLKWPLTLFLTHWYADVGLLAVAVILAAAAAAYYGTTRRISGALRSSDIGTTGG